MIQSSLGLRLRGPSFEPGPRVPAHRDVVQIAHDIVRFLVPQYGYLGADSVYDRESKKYDRER